MVYIPNEQAAAAVCGIFGAAVAWMVASLPHERPHRSVWVLHAIQVVSSPSSRQRMLYSNAPMLRLLDHD